MCLSEQATEASQWSAARAAGWLSLGDRFPTSHDVGYSLLPALQAMGLSLCAAPGGVGYPHLAMWLVEAAYGCAHGTGVGYPRLAMQFLACVSWRQRVAPGEAGAEPGERHRDLFLAREGGPERVAPGGA